MVVGISLGRADHMTSSPGAHSPKQKIRRMVGKLVSRLDSILEVPEDIGSKTGPAVPALPAYPAAFPALPCQPSTKGWSPLHRGFCCQTLMEQDALLQVVPQTVS